MNSHRSSTTSNPSPNSGTSTPGSTTGLSSGGTQPIPKKSQQIKTDKPRPHICSICTRAFARLEHLKRHERSHTNEKPFQCAVCGRCFARRDLVLRHQQKLHGSLPNLMRRGSSKDVDINEHVIVLNNNTDANAPLPASMDTEDSVAFNNGMSTLFTISPGQSQLFSPPKSNELNNQNNHAINQKQQANMRSSLFNHLNSYTMQSQGLGNSYNTTNNSNLIPSPIPTNSNHNTPPTLPSQSIPAPNSTMTQQPSPQAAESPNKTNKAYQKIPHHLRQQFRHASFSASSATSYTNDKDAVDIQQNGAITEEPVQVEFTTPQLTGLDLSSLGIDLNHMDNLDLNNGSHTPQNFNHLQASSKNPLSRNASQYFDQNLIAAHQFSNPSHPHHIEGTTPMEAGMYPTNDAMLQQGSRMRNNSIRNNRDANHHSIVGTNSIPKGEDFEAAFPSVKKQKRKSKPSNAAPETKRNKNDFDLLSDSSEWLDDIINTSYQPNFIQASHHSGFNYSPLNEESSNEIDDVSSLFKARQIDLVRQMNPRNNSIKEQNESDINVVFSINDLNPNFITEELRNRIILVSNLSNLQFPPLDDLNSYMKLYEKEFNKYFPFIHLPSLKNPMADNFANIPLLLSMASIGAIYSYHDNNSLLLFNLSKLHIQQFFEKEISANHLEAKDIPLMAHQCLVLHIFISMFLNEPNMIDITSKQMKSMVGLIKSTNFNRPLEQFLDPPSLITKDKDPKSIQKNFDYFIMAQSRIRTIYCFYMLEVFRTSLTEVPLQFTASNINCGTHCYMENLWRSDDSNKWLDQLTSSSKELVDISNGESLQGLIQDLTNHYSEAKVSFNGLLSLIMYIHEQISVEVLDASDLNPTVWRLNSRPRLESLLKSWESFFIKNNGFLVINDHNKHLLSAHNEFKLILPLYSFAKIRLCLNFTNIMEKVLCKDWKGMNESMELLNQDTEGLKESVSYAVDIVTVWIHNVTLVNYRPTTLRTPVFFVTCVFASIMIISEYLNSMEHSDSQNLYPSDKVLWVKCEAILRDAENVLTPIRGNKSYSDFLEEHSNGKLESSSLETVITEVKKLVASNSDSQTIITSINKAKLSVKSLYLGLHILADTSVWRLAIGLAEALKNRATHIISHK